MTQTDAPASIACSFPSPHSAPVCQPIPAVRPGSVTLVGAGPGDPGLITVAGLAALRVAEVVVYDALVNPTLLAEAPAQAERIDAGKRAREHRLTQDQTNQLLVDLARAGRRVVRLKGGDPYLFGRGAEEAAFLARAGVACQIVPGITAGIAAPMYAGIPVTHRQVASSVTFLTGHEDPARPESHLDYGALARMIAAGGTACFYMGVGQVQGIADRLIGEGLSGDLPAAAIQWGTTPRQRACRATLAALPGAIAKAGLGAPAILVLGQVAGIEEPGLDFFTARPLLGQRVVITRSSAQASALREPLEALGAEVLEAPTIRIEPAAPDARALLQAELARLNTWDWLVLTSVNGTTVLAEALAEAGLDARALAGTRIAVLGPAMAADLREKLRIRPDLVPDRAVGEALAECLVTALGEAQRQVSQPVPARCLLLRGDRARPVLAESLQAAGAQVLDVPVYRTVTEENLPDAVLAALEAGTVDWITFTSASTAENLADLLGARAEALLAGVQLASIGPITTAALERLKWPVALEAQRSDVPGLVAALAAAGAGGIRSRAI